MGLVITLLLVGGLFYAFIKIGSPRRRGKDSFSQDYANQDWRGNSPRDYGLRDSDSSGGGGSAD